MTFRYAYSMLLKSVGGRWKKPDVVETVRNLKLVHQTEFGISNYSNTDGIRKIITAAIAKADWEFL